MKYRKVSNNLEKIISALKAIYICDADTNHASMNKYVATIASQISANVLSYSFKKLFSACFSNSSLILSGAATHWKNSDALSITLEKKSKYKWIIK